MLRRWGLPRLLAGADRPLRRGGAVFVLTGAPGLDHSGQVQFGRVLMRVWLTFNAAGLACHPLSQLVDCPVTRERIADRLGTDPLSVLHLARVGLPAEPPARSGRRR